MWNASVFAQHADVRLHLGDGGLVLGPQTGRMTREYEGVAIKASAISIHYPTGVVDGVVVVVSGNHPVVII